MAWHENRDAVMISAPVIGLLNGTPAGKAAASFPGLDGAIRLGEGYTGLIDELEIFERSKTSPL